MKKIYIDTCSVWFIVCLLFPHYKPPFLSRIGNLETILNIFRIFSALIIILLFINKTRTEEIQNNRRETRIFASLICYDIWILISTLFNKFTPHYFLLYFASQVTVIIICIYYSAYSRKNLIRAIFYIGEFLTYINFVTILLFPGGMWRSELYWQNWFLGYKNVFVQYYLGFFVSAFLYMYYEKRILRPLMLISTMFLSLIIVDSSTAIVACGVYIILAIFMSNCRLVNSITLTIVNIFLFVLIVVFRAVDSFLFIINLLQKSSTLTYRLLLWDDIYKLIGRRPWIGYGFRGTYATEILGRGWANHAHNVLLEALFEGGIPCLFLYLLFTVLVIRNLFIERDSYAARILSIGVFVLNISLLTEVYDNAAIFVFWGLAVSVRSMSTIYEKYMNGNMELLE